MPAQCPAPVFRQQKGNGIGYSCKAKFQPSLCQVYSNFKYFDQISQKTFVLSGCDAVRKEGTLLFAKAYVWVIALGVFWGFGIFSTY